MHHRLDHRCSQQLVFSSEICQILSHQVSTNTFPGDQASSRRSKPTSLPEVLLASLLMVTEADGPPFFSDPAGRSSEYWLHHMGRKKTLSAVLQLQHYAGLILSNIQVLQQFVTSLNWMSSEVMRVAFDREPFPSESDADCGAGSPGSTGGALYGGHVIVTTTQYAGDSWPPAVVVMQLVHVMCRLSPGSPKVAAYYSGLLQ